HADVLASAAQNVSQESGHRRLAVRTGHGADRYPAVLAWREQVGDDRVTHGARLPFTGADVHAQAWGRVHLDDAPVHGLGDVAGDEIDSAHVQADQGRS